MTDLLASVIRLRALTTAPVPLWVGPAVRAWFLTQVTAHDTTLIANLHQLNQQNPYTVSSLLGMQKNNSGAFVSSNAHYEIRITSLWSPLTRLLLDNILPGLPEQEVTLANTGFLVESVATNAKEHRLAGTSTDALLFQKFALNTEPLSKDVGFRFTSPTIFRSNEQTQPFPLPSLVFGSLSDRWNAFNDTRIIDSVRDFSTEAVELRRYDLKTVTTVRHQGDHREHATGFIGYARYVVHRRDRYWLGVIHTLAGYAFFAGAGKHTTEGFGQVGMTASSVSVR